MENYSISELIYYYSHPDEAELIEKQIEINFDLSPLIELALATNDKDWFISLTNRG
jgi:hypothetical protein